METTTTDGTAEVEEDVCLSIPRGGPIFVPCLVGPLTRVPDFECSLFHELQSLEAELCLDSSGICDDDIDISVDELKVYSEEELFDMAMKEAEDSKDVGNSSQHPEEQSLPKESEKCNREENSNKRRRRTRKKRRVIADLFPKVEQLVEIKQKQEEEKLAARLHSFNAASSRKNESATPSLEKTERMISLRSTNTLPKIKPSKIHEHKGVEYPEVILCIEAYHGRNTTVKTQEFLVLGRQTLTELKDNICCSTDQVMKKAGVHDPSGFFLIEDMFCNDLRDSSSIDYSEPIFDWLRDSKEEALRKWECITTGELQKKQKAVIGEATGLQLPRFRSVEMHNTRFCDLAFRLGAAYLYCHQGQCKHTIVIRDMRLFHPEDVQIRTAYPILIYQMKARTQKCRVCKIYGADKVTVDDRWAKENPCYFCENCYYLLHYSEDGSLLYNDFSVYDYLHD